MNNKSQHKRKSIRLKEFDYSNTGWYYVTICSYEKQKVFGNIIKGKMELNKLGKIVEEEWLKTKKIRNNVDLDDYVIMPNHVHGIIIIESRGELNSPRSEGVMHYAPTNTFKSPSQSLGSIVRGFKSAVTKQIRIAGVINFKWQRNYYDHIIRNDKDLHRIRTYIQNNPLKWELDDYFNR